MGVLGFVYTDGFIPVCHVVGPRGCVSQSGLFLSHENGLPVRLTS